MRSTIPLVLLAACASIEAAPAATFRVDRTVRAKAARLEVHYVELGSAEASAKTPVVYLHPWGADLDIWIDVATPIAVDRRSLLVDLPAHGGSSQPPGRYPPRRLAQAVLSALDDAGIEKAIFVGNSIGGGTALAVAEVDPARVAGLVLVGAPGAIAIPRPLRELAARVANPRALATLSPGVLEILWGVATGGDDTPALRRLVARAVASREAKGWEARATAQASELREVIFFEPALEKIHVPTLVMHGEDDRIVWPNAGRALAERIPGAKLVMIEDCGHFPEAECPDQFIPPFRAFLDTIDR